MKNVCFPKLGFGVKTDTGFDNLIERISPNGAKRKFTFDDDNRLIKEEHFLPSTTTASKTNSYTYDQRGLLLTYNDGLTSGAYMYNKKGEKTNETNTFGIGAGSFSKSLARTYEANGLLKSLTYPGTSGALNFTYDSNNQLATYKIPGLAANNDTLAYTYRWNAISEVTMPGNLKRTVTLDALQRPTRILVLPPKTDVGLNDCPHTPRSYSSSSSSCSFLRPLIHKLSEMLFGGKRPLFPTRFVAYVIRRIFQIFGLVGAK
jgi:hypothetical protein